MVNHLINYYKDRLYSFTTGNNPLSFPSGFPTRLYSTLAWNVQAKTLKTFCSLWEENSNMCTEKTYKGGKNKGKSWPIVTGHDPSKYGYKIPYLNEEGVKLLGIGYVDQTDAQ